MRLLVSVLLVLVGVIHLLPLAGALGGERLTALYGLRFDDPNAQVLMRHRAVLFGLLGGFCCVAAVAAQLQPAAFAMGYVSVVSFLALMKSVGGTNAQLRRVFVADVVALACLVVGTAAHALAPRA